MTDEAVDVAIEFDINQDSVHPEESIPVSDSSVDPDIKQESPIDGGDIFFKFSDVTPVDSGKVETEPGVHIHYETHGNGPEKVLLVMGLGGSGYVWYPCVCIWGKLYPG